MTSPQFPQPPQPQAYAGPAGAGQLAAPLQPPPPTPPPPEAEVPHAGEAPLQPGQIGFYAYEHPADKPGVKRVQAIQVTHADEDHVHGFVVGELRDLASFLHGQLARSPHAAAGS